jgi:uncharacterized RDD family membrane protein YckC
LRRRILVLTGVLLIVFLCSPLLQPALAASSDDEITAVEDLINAVQGTLAIISGLAIIVATGARGKRYFTPSSLDRLYLLGHKVGANAKYCPECGEKLDIESLVSELPGGQYILAGGLRRLGAQIVDTIIVGFIILIPIMIIPAKAESLADVTILVSLALSIAYFLTCWALWGTTGGKRAFGMLIVTQSGGKPGFEKAVVRFVVMVLLSFGMIAWWLLIWRKDNRGVHDLVAGTYVVWEPITSSNAGRNRSSAAQGLCAARIPHHAANHRRSIVRRADRHECGRIGHRGSYCRAAVEGIRQAGEFLLDYPA